jgi:assimilatory nitrate reductase catalytic subunit
MSAPVRTTCPYCGTGCGVAVSPSANSGWTIDGDAKHPANFGKLCAKGSALAETLGPEARLLNPAIAGKHASWDQALDLIAHRFEDIAQAHGPESVAFYLSGQLLTEDYYVANKLAKGFIGTPHVDTNSRLCMASSVAGHKRAFGSDTVPGCYEDLDLADLIVLVGSNTAWNHPILFQRMLASKRVRGARIVAIDVRETTTTAACDLALSVLPGSDSWLFNGLLAYLAANGALDKNYIESYTTGFDAALAAARVSAPDVRAVARATGLTVSRLRRFYELFAGAARTVTCYSQGINQSSSGTDKVNAIINCHLATGRIGKPGAGPFSLTGQPNAMGGREVGGLANQLAAHMDFDATARDRVGRFWNAPRLVNGPGLKAVEMFDALHEGRIKAMWVLCTNPAVSLPNSERVTEALKSCEFLVVSDCVSHNDTIAHAHVRLPAAAWGEKSGTVTNSERRISRQRAFQAPRGEAKPDWWALAEVGRRLGFEQAFNYASAADVFREHAALSAFENDGSRDFDLTGLARMSDEDYDALAPVQWPARDGLEPGTARLFADGKYFHPDGKARFVAVEPRGVAQPVDESFPLYLNTGRLRDQWHTMTRTGLVPALNDPWPEPLLEIAPADAVRYDLSDGELARVRSRYGDAILRVRATEGQPVGQVFAPIHWSRANSAASGIGPLVAPHVDPVSGQPENKATPVKVSPFPVIYSGLLIARTERSPAEADYWVRLKSDGRFVHLLGFSAEPQMGWLAWCALALGVPPEYLMRFTDEGRGIFRAAHLDEGTLISAALIVPGFRPPAVGSLATWFADVGDTEQDRRSLLALADPVGAETRVSP